MYARLTRHSLTLDPNDSSSWDWIRDNDDVCNSYIDRVLWRIMYLAMLQGKSNWCLLCYRQPFGREDPLHRGPQGSQKEVLFQGQKRESNHGLMCHLPRGIHG